MPLSTVNTLRSRSSMSQWNLAKHRRPCSDAQCRSRTYSYAARTQLSCQSHSTELRIAVTHVQERGQTVVRPSSFEPVTEPRRSWSGAGAQNLQNKRRGRVFHLGSTLGVELDLTQRQTIGWKHRDDIEFQHLKLLQRRRDIFRCCLEQSDPPADRSHVVMARTPLPAPQAPGPLICTMVAALAAR